MKNLTLLERYEALKEEVSKLTEVMEFLEDETIRPKLQELLELRKNLLIANCLNQDSPD